MKELQERKSNRWKGYDYTEKGYYFITVCTKDRIPWFGKIEGGKMILNEAGKVVRFCWDEIPAHFEGIQLDEFVIMPNHVHGIVIIGNGKTNVVGNRHACSLPAPRRQHQTIPVVIGAFKSVVTRRLNEKWTDGERFQWQKSYYDHVIGGESSLLRIRNYIRNNPSKWESDPENPMKD